MNQRADVSSSRIADALAVALGSSTLLVSITEQPGIDSPWVPRPLLYSLVPLALVALGFAVRRTLPATDRQPMLAAVARVVVGIVFLLLFADRVFAVENANNVGFGGLLVGFCLAGLIPATRGIELRSRLASR